MGKVLQMDGLTETQQHLEVDGVRVYATLEGGEGALT